jgi:hypothetical protein
VLKDTLTKESIKTVNNVLTGVKIVLAKTSVRLVKGKIETKPIFLNVDAKRGILMKIVYLIVMFAHINVKTVKTIHHALNAEVYTVFNLLTVNAKISTLIMELIIIVNLVYINAFNAKIIKNVKHV